MPGRGRSRSGVPSADALAALALYGSERRAAAALGVARSTLHDAVKGLTGLSRTITNAIGGLAPEQRQRVETTRQSLTAGRTPEQQQARARELAREERRAPGSTERQAAEHQQRMAQQGLTLTGEPLPADVRRQQILDRLTGGMQDPKHGDQGLAPGSGTLEQRVQQNAPPGSWEDLEALWADGDLDDDFYEAAVAVMVGSGPGGTGVPIAGMLD